MKDKSRTDELDQAWERAVERAAENTRPLSEADRARLNDAVGVHVRSGVQSGVWGSAACSGGCTVGLASC